MKERERMEIVTKLGVSEFLYFGDDYTIIYFY